MKLFDMDSKEDYLLDGKYKVATPYAPLVDVVQVVRCKDCKHKYVSGNGTTQYYVCDFMDAQYDDDGFCHHAEREVEEE